MSAFSRKSALPFRPADEIRCESDRRDKNQQGREIQFREEKQTCPETGYVGWRGFHYWCFQLIVKILRPSSAPVNEVL
jgi:hypothetical protein